MPKDSKDTWTSDTLQRNDLAAILQRVLDDPAYLTSRDYLGDTPLLTAIGFGNLELVEFLLAKGADPNVAVDDGYTCLLSAVESDESASTAIVAALLAAGADVHQTGTNGWTPLHMAAVHGHHEKAKLLIDAGANVNQRTEIDAQETPLMEAAHSGRPETIQLLLDSGADATLRDVVHNRTPLEIAQYTTAGPDPAVYQYLKQENIQAEVGDMFDGVDLPEELLAMLKEQLGHQDMAENYLQNAKQIAESGDHAEVIRILQQHQAQR